MSIDPVEALQPPEQRQHRLVNHGNPLRSGNAPAKYSELRQREQNRVTTDR